MRGARSVGGAAMSPGEHRGLRALPSLTLVQLGDQGVAESRSAQWLLARDRLTIDRDVGVPVGDGFDARASFEVATTGS